MQDPAYLRKLDQATDRDRPIGEIVRPAPGWLRIIREALGITLTDLAKRLKVTPPAVRSFEQAEAEDRITLASLRRTADAMGCELVYALIPRTGTLLTLTETETRARQGSPPAAAPLPQTEATNDAAKKVTDLTWRTLHGDS